MTSWFLGCCRSTGFSTTDTDEEAAASGEAFLASEVIVDQPTTRVDMKQETGRGFLLCCAGQSIRPDQVDLCPRLWWSSPCKGDLDDLHGGQKEDRCACFRAWCWRLCFLTVCLPLCYPCYLSRTCRRRRLDLQRVFEKSVEDIVGKFSDDLNNTMLRQVYLVRKEKEEEEEDISRQVINVNVIILKSTSSGVLQQHLLRPNQVDAVGKPPFTTAKRAQNLFSANLSTVHEEDSAHCDKSEDDELFEEVTEECGEQKHLRVPLITVDTVDGECDSDNKEEEEEKTNVRKSNVTRRWSKLATFGRTTARFASTTKSNVEDEKNHVQLRKNSSGGQGGRRRGSRKMSVVSGSSIFYSYDSECDSEDQYEASNESVEMKDLGNRIVLLKDLGYQVSFSVFDEASVASWRGRDLRQANRIPNIDIIVLAIRQDNAGEISQVLDVHSGIMSYIAKFWRGFYPLLLIELQSQKSSIEDNSDYLMKLGLLKGYFGDIHHIKVFESELNSSLDWLNQCMARLFIHSRLHQCSRFFGSGVTRSLEDYCPGGCGLRKTRNMHAPAHRLSRQKVMWKKTRSSQSS